MTAVTAESGSETWGFPSTGGPGSGAAAGRRAMPAANGGGGNEVGGATSDGIGVNGEEGAGRGASGCAGGAASMDHPLVVVASASSPGRASVGAFAGSTGMTSAGLDSSAGIAGFVGA